MLTDSDLDLDRIILEKRREIQMEKIYLGLSPPSCNDGDKENVSGLANKPVRRVAFQESEKHEITEEKRDRDSDRCQIKHEEEIPPDLERYIRRYIGLPGMLKAGEYSPNNPLLRSERIEGDALLGLGEYERQRRALRRLRQQQYREHLDLQAKKKQEEKDQAEKERREREERERLREAERERARQQGAETGEERRASVCYVSSENSVNSANNAFHTKKVDTGVQVSFGNALTVGVQTDDGDLYQRLSPSKAELTQAERELSPRTVMMDHVDDRLRNSTWAPQRERDRNRARNERDGQRRHSYQDFDERPIKRASHGRLSDTRHTPVPSIFDAEAIRLRNLQAEQETAARRQQYQEELRKQIEEQRRIREERRAREKMLEQAEMRRLEKQLDMLKAAQDKEHGRHQYITAAMKENAADYDRKRVNLQKEIDFEKRTLRTIAPPSHAIVKSNSTLPFSYPRMAGGSPERNHEVKLPFSTIIPENSIFSQNYDVDSYLRRHLNPSKESLMSNRISTTTTVNTDYFNEKKDICDNNVVVEKALVHDCPIENVVKKSSEKLEDLNQNQERERKKTVLEKPNYEPSFKRRDLDEITRVDETPIPVLRHSPKTLTSVPKSDDHSDQMKRIDDKWKVPAVQKNILKSLPNDEGKKVSILLTQLGSIRRQLQLEQLKLDNMLPDDDV